MAGDGRLTIRFDELLPAVRAAAKDSDRKPSDWVRAEIKRALQQRRTRGRTNRPSTRAKAPA